MRPVRTLISLTLTLALLLTLAALPVSAVEGEESDSVPQTTEADAQTPAEPDETQAAPAETEPVEAAPEEPTADPVLIAPAPQAPALTDGHPVYVQGFPNGTFRPDGDLTRAQAVQMVVRLLADPDGGTGPCSFTDVPAKQWYAAAIRQATAWGLVDDGTSFRPDALMSRGDFVSLLVRLHPEAVGEARFTDVGPGNPAYDAIGAAAALGWVDGYPDGTFRPNRGLTRAEAVTVLNRASGRTGDAAEAKKLLTMGLFPDVGPGHWAGTAILEAALAHTPSGDERWSGLDYGAMTFRPGFHDVGGKLYYADRNGKLAVSRKLGAYTARADGSLTWDKLSYVTPNVPYMSQIDNIYAWVGCEAVAALPGLRVKGFAQSVTLRKFLDALPRAASDPEKGFVGSPYVPDKTKRTRTTIYPAKLAEYCNSYCGGQTPCADFRGASVTDLQRELLAGNLVVGYMTLWWAPSTTGTTTSKARSRPWSATTTPCWSAATIRTRGTSSPIPTTIITGARSISIGRTRPPLNASGTSGWWAWSSGKNRRRSAVKKTCFFTEYQLTILV